MSPNNGTETNGDAKQSKHRVAINLFFHHPFEVNFVYNTRLIIFRSCFKAHMGGI